MPAETIVLDLQPLTWRGLSAPCASAPFRFSHSQAERRFPYIDGAGHDWTGLDPIPFSVRLYFVNTVEPDSFPGNWTRWQAALFDGSPGELQHPVLGRVFARVLDGSVELVAQNLGGVIVDVTFTNTREDLDEGLIFETLDINAEAAAEAADDALEALDIELPDTIPPVASLLEAYRGLKGEFFSLSLTLSGLINQVKGIVAEVMEDVERLNDHSAWPAMVNLMYFYDSLRQLSEKAEKSAARSTAKKVVQNDTTLEAFAAEVGNTLNDIMGLNLGLLISPIVPAGSTVRYYTS